MKEIFQEYGGLIIAVIVIGLLITYVTDKDQGFVAKLTDGIGNSVTELFTISGDNLPGK